MGSTLLVDGDNLLTIGFYGMKNHFYKDQHIGGIYHFLNTLKIFLEKNRLDKVVVFWDGEDGSLTRRKIYPNYKMNRKGKEKTEHEINSYNFQRNRIKQYLEEIYVRQGEFDYCETDDCIAQYVKTSNENIIIYSSDGDLAQLVGRNVKLYSPSHRNLYESGDTIEYKKNNILIDNIKLVKILCGDPSDNILGIKNLGIKRLLSIYPDLQERVITIDEFKSKCDLLLEESKYHNNLLKNILTGVTKEGVYGDEFYEINQKIISLDEPLLTEEAIEGIRDIILEEIDPDGRSYRNIIKMMTEDGIFQFLPKRDDKWVNFLNPFLMLTRKEKNKIIKRKIKIKNNE